MPSDELYNATDPEARPSTISASFVFMIFRNLARASRRAVITSASIVYLVTLSLLYICISSIYADDPLSPLYRQPLPSYPLSDRLRNDTESWVRMKRNPTTGGEGDQVPGRIHGNSVAVDDDGLGDNQYDDEQEGEEEGEAMRLCVAVPTKARRNGADYLDLALAGLTRGLTEHQRATIKIMLFFPDGKERERVVREKGLLEGGRGADDGSYLGDVKHPTELEPWLIRQSQERGHLRHIPYALHFMAALDKCLNYGDDPTHILIMEDDVIARLDWYDRLRHEVLPELKRKAEVPWTFVMLFWTEHYMFWSDEDMPVIFSRFIWLALGVLVISIGSAWVLRPNARGYTRIETPSDKAEQGDMEVPYPGINGLRPLTVILLGISVYILLCPFIGLDLYRGKFANYPVPRGLSPRRTNQCCFQSVLFNHRSARRTIEAFKPVVEGKTGYDWESHGQDYLLFLMEEQGRRTSWAKGWVPEWVGGGDGNVKGWAWNPSLFQHFGDVSTYTSNMSGPRFRSWNFELGLRERDQDRRK